MKLETLVQELGSHVRDAVIITEAEPIDLPGPRIVWVNEAFTSMTGYSPEEVIGQTPRMFQGDDVDLAATKRIREALKSWSPVREVLKNYTKDGDPCWIELDIKPVADERGWYCYWVSVQRDVTERILVQEELEKARLEVEAASLAKSQFLANMSHEIRTPLNGVLGMAQVLGLTDLDQRQRRAVETIISSGKALQGLIEDVLDVSRIESGRLLMEPEAVTAHALIRQAGDAVHGVAATKGLELRLEPGPDTGPAFMADPRRVLQVMINLAGNAAKFTQRGCIVLAFRQELKTVVFEVRDSGPGVDPALRDRIFDRFQQADASSIRVHGGLGLGLSIAREIAEAAGGAITVGEAREGGACFTLTLPFVPATTTPVKEAAPGRGDRPGETLRVLLVDDSAVNRFVVEEAFGLSGWSVDSFDCAQAGLEAWRTGRYDVVILDRQMPKLTGEDAIKMIRAEEDGSSHTPILLLTAHAMAGAEEAALEAGADAYLSKPFSLDALVGLTRELADSRR